MDFSVGLSVDQNLARAGCHFDNSMAPMTSIASIFRHSSVQTTTICVRIPLPLWIFCIPRPDKGDNGGAAQQMRTANADAWTMAMAQGPKVPSAASSASSAHRPPPTARTSVEHGADGKAQNNSQRPRVQVGACLKLSWRVPPPPPETSTTPPPSLARPESDQSRCSLAGCHGTLHVQRVLSRCQKKGRPGCHPTTCMRASFPDVPRPQVAMLEMASRCGDFRGVSGKSKSIVETSRTAEHVHIGS